MSREKQIEEMANAMCNLGESNCQECANHWDFVTVPKCDLVKRAERLYNAGYRKQEWISVTERLPEEGKNVLCVEGNKMMIAFMEKVEDCGTFVPVFWDWVAYDSDDTWNEVCSTHWMPLPEPPKGE